MALLEFKTVAAGVLASDRMVKRAPIALLRCGSIHPGRFLILVGGSVASTEEAFLVGAGLGEAEGGSGKQSNHRQVAESLYFHDVEGEVSESEWSSRG